MSAAHTDVPHDLGPRRIDEHLPALNARALGALGAGALGALALTVSGLPQHFYASALVAACFFLSITLGALWFVILQHLVRAGWSVLVRRVAEGVAMNITWVWVLFVPVLIGLHKGQLHPWAAHHDAAAAHEGAAHEGAAHEGAAHDGQPASHEAAAAAAHTEGGEHALTGSKAVYLSPGFFTARLVGYFVLWIGMAVFFCSGSLQQDQSGDPAITSKLQWWAPPAMIVFALTASLAAFDLLMSVDPHWYSTIFGVWYFAGCAVSFFATLILTVFLLQQRGMLKMISAEHYHDVGKLMFGFTVFWAYVSYSQFMLQWYGNIPEETTWYLRRTTGGGGWIVVSYWLLIGHFVAPFLAAISRWVKRAPQLIVMVAVWLLGMHYVDLFWVVLPEFSQGHMALPLLDMALFVAGAGLYAVMTGRQLAGKSLIPEKDPRLAESLHHVNF